jgi:hypothetical protein
MEPVSTGVGYEVRFPAGWRSVSFSEGPGRILGPVNLAVNRFRDFSLGINLPWLSTLPGLELRPLNYPAHSQSLHRLRYRSSRLSYTFGNTNVRVFSARKSDIPF